MNKRSLVIGADYLNPISDLIESYGFSMLHIDGRHQKYQSGKFVFPLSKVTLVIMIVTFLNHNVMKNVRKQAKNRSIPIAACKRAIDDIEDALKIHLGECCK